MKGAEKLALLSAAASFDVCGVPRGKSHERFIQVPGVNLPGGIFWAHVGNSGQCVRLFKVLLTNYCDNNCLYCANRRDADCPRARYTAEELVRTFLMLLKARLVDGLFLSSAVYPDPVRAMDEMIKACIILRRRGFRGYIHLKILPGAESGQIEEAMRIATRVSLNLEAPNQERLSTIAPDKDFFELQEKLRLIRRLQDRGLRPQAGVTTQFVVGAAGERDVEILSTVAELYRSHTLRRTYFSAYRPVPDTPLSSPPASTLREHRLYQVDFLLRFYGFSLDEISFDENGNLPQLEDPKSVWAHRHPEFFPIEVNKADFEELLRVPGIGLKSAKRIIAVRRHSKLHNGRELQKLGVVMKRAAPFITIDGKAVKLHHEQLEFFNEEELIVPCQEG